MGYNRLRLSGKVSKMETGYKLFKLRKDGTLGPLFINRKQRIPVGVWLKAEDHPTPGYKHRPGWHGVRKKYAPHLSTKGRVWCKVQIKEIIDTVKRPKHQGGLWWLASWMRVVKILG